jgi:hypothetical protein
VHRPCSYLHPCKAQSRLLDTTTSSDAACSRSVPPPVDKSLVSLAEACLEKQLGRHYGFGAEQDRGK